MGKDRLICAITMGDPAGVGPEVTLKALSKKGIQGLANFCLIGNADVIKKTARACRINLAIKPVEDIDDAFDLGLEGIALLNIGKISKLVFGRANPTYGKLALDCIRQALKLAESQKIDALVTAAVNKQTINLIDHSFRGHTEYLAEATKTKDFAMMLVGGRLRVVLVTRHIALKEVPGVLTSKKIFQALRLTIFALKKYFGVSHPRLAVCGLNPHAGEGGILGKEEKRIIRPALIRAKALAFIEGPLAADTVFYWARKGRYDAVVAMYHDQGLIPLKTSAFDQVVNITLGLPFVRTSCGHGTAYDLAGKNKANADSMVEAIKLAVAMAKRLKRG